MLCSTEEIKLQLSWKLPPSLLVITVPVVLAGNPSKHYSSAVNPAYYTTRMPVQMCQFRASEMSAGEGACCQA